MRKARHPQAEAISAALDNATCNRAASVREWLAAEGCRVKLVHLPPYAPNPNLIERLWWFFKKKTRRSTHYPTLADFKAGVRGFFSNQTQWQAELASLITNRFHFIGA